MGVQSLVSLWFGLTLPAIVLMYLLKRTYLDTEISSHLLWNRTLRQLEANRPWQKLRNQLLLLLQLIIAALLVLALLQPFLWVDRKASGHVVVIIDRSASMASSDEQDANGQTITRLEKAKLQIEEWITGQGRHSEITLVAIGREPEILVSREPRSGTTAEALQKIQLNYGKTAYKETMSLAAALTREDSDSEIHVWTDGQWNETASGLSFAVPVIIEKVGSSSNNGSIVQFGVKPDETGNGSTSGLAVLKNSGDQVLQGDISLYHGAELAYVNPVVLQPGEQKTIYFQSLEKADYYRVLWDIDDILSVDNQSFAFPADHGKLNALLVTTGNLFLEKALQLAQVEVVKLQPDALAEIPLSLAEIDLLIMDSVEEAVLESKEWQERLALRPVWLLNSPSSAQEINKLSGTVQIENHPVTRYIRLQDTHFANLMNPGVIDWGKAIISIGSQPLIYAGLEHGNPRLLFAFDIHQSDLPLKPEFPIMVQNSVDWLSHSKAGNLGRAIAGDQVGIAIYPSTVNANWALIDAGGQLTEESPAAKGTDGYFSQQPVPNQIGLFQFVERDTTDIPNKTNFLEVIADPAESNLSLMPDLQIQFGNTADTNDRKDDRSPHGLMPWIIAIILLVMAVEWGVYQRGNSV